MTEYILIKDSSIHNKGIFAKRGIPKDTRIIEYMGEKITKKEAEKRAENILKKSKTNKTFGAVYIFELNKKYDIDGNLKSNPARYINHSCKPNCKTEIIKGKIWIIAKRNILPGEEISYDYGYDINNFKEHICRCGSKNCIGYIVGKEHWSKLK
ncbi:MAG: SET domain-containing protein-lysine N-methyltransferase, partial [Nanoarchaeota archaeon]|nr:SET domain-containing protein-lysine N-methyltransferase [Nanoarchaeota archaeon]